MPDTRTLHIQIAPRPTCALCGGIETTNYLVHQVVRHGSNEPLLAACESCLRQLRTPLFRLFDGIGAEEARNWIREDQRKEAIRRMTEDLD